MPMGPTAEAVGPIEVPREGAAEDTRFELSDRCSQHAFHIFVRGFGGVRWCSDLGWSGVADDS